MKAVFNVVLAALCATLQVLAAENPSVSDPFMAEYEGFWSASNGTKGRMTAQVRPLGNDNYDGFILLKRAKAPITAFKLRTSTHENGMLRFEGVTAKEAGGDLLAQNQVTAQIKDGKLTGKFSGELGEGAFEAPRSKRKSRTLGARPPRHSIVLFDGETASGWKDLTWPIKNGALEVGTDNLQAKDHLSNFRLHIEFCTPFMPEASGQDRGNSGVYLQGKYELQVLDSFGIYPLKDNDCGGIYRVKAPGVNACLPPGQWQTYDITYLEGNGSARPRITVALNGVVLMERAEIPAALVEKGTGGGTSAAGFLMLQNHGNPVQFRNIWAQPIYSSQKLR